MLISCLILLELNCHLIVGSNVYGNPESPGGVLPEDAFFTSLSSLENSTEIGGQPGWLTHPLILFSQFKDCTI